MEQLKARLEAELAERERLAQTRQDLEREAQAMRAQIHSLSRQLSSQPPDQAPPAGDRGDPEAWEENEHLREEVLQISPCQQCAFSVLHASYCVCAVFKAS